MAELDKFTEGDPTEEVQDVQDTQEATVDWDAERQRADQAEANFRKAQATKEEAERKAAEAETRVREAEEKARSLEDKMVKYADDRDIDLSNLDKDLVGENTINVLSAMQSKIDAANARVEQLQTLAKDYEKREEEKAQTAKKEQAKMAVVARVEQEFSPKLRNKALELAAKKCDARGYPPQSDLDAYLVLRDCYQELSSEAPKSKKAVATDTAGGKVAAAPQQDDIKSGTLREVAAQVRKRARTG
jgi:hypothetical protein